MKAAALDGEVEGKVASLELDELVDVSAASVGCEVEVGAAALELVDVSAAAVGPPNRASSPTPESAAADADGSAVRVLTQGRAAAARLKLRMQSDRPQSPVAAQSGAVAAASDAPSGALVMNNLPIVVAQVMAGLRDLSFLNLKRQLVQLGVQQSITIQIADKLALRLLALVCQEETLAAVDAHSARPMPDGGSTLVLTDATLSVELSESGAGSRGGGWRDRFSTAHAAAEGKRGRTMAMVRDSAADSSPYNSAANSRCTSPLNRCEEDAAVGAGSVWQGQKEQAVRVAEQVSNAVMASVQQTELAGQGAAQMLVAAQASDDQQAVVDAQHALDAAAEATQIQPASAAGGSTHADVALVMASGQHATQMLVTAQASGDQQAVPHATAMNGKSDSCSSPSSMQLSPGLKELITEVAIDLGAPHTSQPMTAAELAPMAQRSPSLATQSLSGAPTWSLAAKVPMRQLQLSSKPEASVTTNHHRQQAERTCARCGEARSNTNSTSRGLQEEMMRYKSRGLLQEELAGKARRWVWLDRQAVPVVSCSLR